MVTDPAKGGVTDARSCELAEGGFCASDRNPVSPNNLPTQESTLKRFRHGNRRMTWDLSVGALS
jgi:hypothetical protein